MRTRTAQILYAYWNAMRGDRLAPRRFEIEPARIADILPETFILERAERADLRYRLAGTRICENFGAEFRGRSFFEGWAAGDLGAVGECADRVLHEGGVGLLSIEALTAGGRGARFEVLLLPLTHTRDHVERVLGAITAISDEPWLGAEPLLERRPHRLSGGGVTVKSGRIASVDKGAWDRTLGSFEKDHEFMLKGDVFTADFIKTWIDYKRTKEVDTMRLRPHPYEFMLYFDI